MGFRVEVRDTPSRVFVDVSCDRCGELLPEQANIPPDGSLQYNNNLVVRLEGGYGMFCDPEPSRGPSLESGSYDPELTKVFCHDCAHELADWLGLDVSGWHTHDPASGQHPDHHGGDLLP